MIVETGPMLVYHDTQHCHEVDPGNGVMYETEPADNELATSHSHNLIYDIGENGEQLDEGREIETVWAATNTFDELENHTHKVTL